MLNVKYFISLYNCKEFDNLICDAKFITKNFILSYGYFKTHYYNNPLCEPIHDVVLFGSVTNYIYPLRNKLYHLLKNIDCSIFKTFVLENNTNFTSATKLDELTELLN